MLHVHGIKEIVKAWWITESGFPASQGINGGPETSSNLPNATQWVSRSAPVLSHMPLCSLNSSLPSSAAYWPSALTMPGSAKGCGIQIWCDPIVYENS